MGCRTDLGAHLVCLVAALSPALLARLLTRLRETNHRLPRRHAMPNQPRIAQARSFPQLGRMPSIMERLKATPFLPSFWRDSRAIHGNQSIGLAPSVISTRSIRRDRLIGRRYLGGLSVRQQTFGTSFAQMNFP